MSRLAGASDGMIGVDTHRDSLAAATTDPVGGLLAQASVRADGAGYRRLLDFALARVPRRPWTPSAPPRRRSPMNIPWRRVVVADREALRVLLAPATAPARPR
jgi:hypothetical protein